MIDVKQAVAAATTYFRTLYNTDALSDILLEEVELTDDERLWIVTLSALLPASNEELNETVSNALATSLGGNRQHRRVYKVFTVSAENGRVRSMKIRQSA